MPLYEYDCAVHGPFEESASVSAFAAPAVCPACGAESPRVLSAPNLRCLAPGQRIARDRNERSQHAPRLEVRPAAPASDGRRPVMPTPGGRPWMLGHS